jgi:hypothetical protein
VFISETSDAMCAKVGKLRVSYDRFSESVPKGINVVLFGWVARPVTVQKILEQPWKD